MVRKLVCWVPAALVSLLLLAGSATAVTPAARLKIESFALPSNFSVGDQAGCESPGRGPSAGTGESLCDAYQVTVTNVGSVPTDGSPVTISDSLPAGLTVQGVYLLLSGDVGADAGNVASLYCHTAPMQCRFPEALAPSQRLTLDIFVTVQPGAAGSLLDTASVSGGGVAEAMTSVRNTNGSVPPPFGVSLFSSLFAGLDGLADTRAGGHPYELTTRLDLATAFKISPENVLEDSSIHNVKDVVVDLPLGYAGSALAAPTCTLAQLASALPAQVNRHLGGCPPDTVIGHIDTEPTVGSLAIHSRLYNMVPERGVVAEFGFVDFVHTIHVLYARVASTPAGYVLRTTSSEIPQVTLDDILVSIYGNPAARDGGVGTPVAMFTNPSNCSGEPLVTRVHLDSWQEPGSYNADGSPNLSDPRWVEATSSAPPVTGCDQLLFDPSISAQPETTAADTPSGLNVAFKVPQSEDPETLATPPVRKAVVALPAGLVVNPSAANGLQTCSLGQIGLGSDIQPTCPDASKIGTVEVQTPALPGVLEGSIYLASQNENPFHTLLAGYIVVEDPTTGVLLKVPGRIDPDPATGQLTATFDEGPQFPFGELKVHFFGGARAALRTPAACGTYTSNAVLTPWSAPDSGPPASASASFQISSGCGGGFAPSFSAGTVGNQAAGFSPFTLTLARQDGEQGLGGVTVTTPPGLLGILKSVQQCGEPQASQGTCGAASLIGHTTVAAGSGPDPLWVQGGQVFLTGPYKGAPFGLSIVVPAVAGPFNLGTVVVRDTVSVDSHTAQITVSSDPLPTILDGIPLDLRTVNVAIDRPGFTFNPTSCEPLTVGGLLTSTQGVTANVSSRFQAADCANLAFKPSFKVSTQARTSKKNGASLDVKVGYPSGEQANIHTVAVTLPKQLPARLTTIQQACPEATFAANPASCPAGSVIGTGVAKTPVLASPVAGPAYLVSHGGAAFPDLVMILQGEGVKLELVGSIDIKKGVTSSTFASVPDAPISSFELTLPQGPHSGLAAVVPAKAKGNLCGQTLTMPTTISGQNGAVVKQNTKIAVTGCPKAKKKAKATRKHTRGTRGKKGKQGK